MSFDYFWRRCLVICGCVLILAGCSPKEHDAVVATVAGQPITLSQYENQYLRNAPSRDSASRLSLTDRERFLDLLVNYRLKLEDAKTTGLENKPSVKNEIRQYKGGLTQSYITDREIVQPALREMYQRRTEEVRARHLLLTLPPTASPADSIAAYKKANEIIAALKAGTPFDVLAKQYSIDPSAKQNGGDLYYFSGGMMVPAFEDAVWAMKPGQVSIVRTNYGLHVVQMLERHPSPGEIDCAHIMIRFPSAKPTPEDTAKAYALATSILDSLKQGVDFAGLAKRNSGDPGSAVKGGDLGWFGRRRWVQEFDEQAFKLKPGEYSGIVRSPYGYHIIKCLAQRPLKSFEDMKQELSTTYQQTRAESDYANELARVKKNLGFVLNDQPIKEFLATCDTTKTTHDADWDSTLTAGTLGRSVVFSARGQTMTFDSVASMINQHTDFPVAALRFNTFMNPVNKVAELFVWTVAADSFAGKYPDFASLLSEYRDGVILYQMEQENVWNKISVNDSLLRLYFEKNRQKFVWPDRLDLTELRMATLENAEKVAAKINAGETFEQIAAEDSARMIRPARWSASFTGNTTSLTALMKKTLAAAVAELQREPGLTLDVTAHPDTGKGPDAKIPRQRLDAVKKYLTTTLKVDTTRIRTYERTLGGGGPVPQMAKEDRLNQFRQIELALSVKQPLVIARPASSLLAVNADERAVHADSLKVGGTSSPFQSRGIYLIVRLNAREPSHLKTFDEAQPEVSGMYQDYQSEQLKDAWIKGLRSKYPVEEHPEVLREAFASSSK